jgi:hypothetical protein
MGGLPQPPLRAGLPHLLALHRGLRRPAIPRLRHGRDVSNQCRGLADDADAG